MNNNFVTYQLGESKNQAIIFIHGFPFDHKMWDFQTNYFQKLHYCISYDIRGLGQSPAGDGQYTIEGLVDDLFELIETHKLNKPVLCGLSMGGYIALRAVERDENKFSRIILCDTKAEADSNEGKISRAKAIKEISVNGGGKFADNFVRKCFSDEFMKNKKKEFEEILIRAKNSNSVGLKGCLLAMAARTDTTGYLSKIKVPVLLICGEQDKLTPPEIMKSMNEKIINSEFAIVPGAGHVSAVENPEFFNTEAEKFLKMI